jgi:hypothetical protein
VIIDCCEERLKEIDNRLKQSVTLVGVLRCMREADQVRAEIAKSQAEVFRLAQGWSFVVPPRAAA